jgi:protein kinase-like protein/zinc ribbon protein
MTCPSCSRSIPEGSRFCPHCGASADAIAFDATRTSAASRGLSASVPSDHGRFLPGTMLGDRYRVVGLLGRGGMGEVYRADDLKLGQAVALKFLPEVVESDPARLQRFLNEVKIARQISHPNVCRVYDVGAVDGQHFLSMEYVDGEDLASLLRRIGRLPGDKAIQIARQLCAGLAAAHDKGVLHRDLKPANVMLDGEGRVRITDFGLAAVVGQVTGADVHAGTPGYMAPEQLAGKEVSIASDVFSLGIVLFELFTGKQVFKASSSAELARLHQENRTSPSSLVPDLDPAVERVILRCLARHPAERPSSALAVAAALPGGDPLAAALAAGETPSPEMVAAAGEAGGLRPLTAWLALAGVVVLLVPLVAFQGRVSILGRTPLPKEPQVLKAEARALLKEAGYPDAPADSLWGFQENKLYLDELEKIGTPDRWDRLGTGPRTGLTFWYRESPAPLLPIDPVSYRMSATDPPSISPGMATVWMDPSGSLLRMQVVPPERASPAASGAEPLRTDWNRLLSAANLRETDLHGTESMWNPPFHSDERRAWTGPFPGDKDAELRIEAASYAGRPVYFRVVRPWEKPAESAADPQTKGERAGQVFASVLLVVVLLGGLLLARRNMRLGRSDRNGAFRIASIFVAVHMLGWIFWGTYFADVNAMINSFIGTLAATLFEGVMLWILYLALEPYVRKRWPETIISWTRALAGRFRDPLVGRDMLLGCLLGVAMRALSDAPRWLGLDPRRPDGIRLPSLASTRHLFGEFLDGQIHSLVVPMLFLVLLLLFGVVLRRMALAAAAIMVVFSLFGWAFGHHWLDPVSTLLFAGVVLFSLTRFGLLATTVVFAVGNALDFCITSDLFAWYGAGTILAVVWILAIAGYGFHTSFAGRALFGEKFLQE